MHKLWMELHLKRKANYYFLLKGREHSIHFSILVMDIFIQKLPSPFIWTILKPLQQWLSLSHHLRTFLIQHWSSQFIQKRNHLLLNPGNKMARSKLLTILGLPLFSPTFYQCPKPFIEVQGRLEVLQNLFLKF